MIAANCRRSCWFSCLTVYASVCVCVFCACPLSVGIQIWPMQRSAAQSYFCCSFCRGLMAKATLIYCQSVANTCKRIRIWVCECLCVSVSACEYEYSFELQQPLWESRYGIAKLSLPPLDIGSFSTGFSLFLLPPISLLPLPSNIVQLQHKPLLLLVLLLLCVCLFGLALCCNLCDALDTECLTSWNWAGAFAEAKLGQTAEVY